jgi:phosphoribosyl-ATP pyrophosphohydrolase/phosphoribosyl-AMP cyclohydrolase
MIKEDKALSYGWIEKIQWDKVNGLLPVVIQSYLNQSVLMLGYMNQEALTETLKRGKVVFWSRTKQRLWEKGESSGHYLILKSLQLDCDADALIVQAIPQGPTCHQGTDSCFSYSSLTPDGASLPAKTGYPALSALEQTIQQRKTAISSTNKAKGLSYTQQLLVDHPKRLAQKVGEEGVEVALAAVSGNIEELKSEAADLLYHLLVLLSSHNLRLVDIDQLLAERAHT